MPKTLALIPAFNEAPRIGPVIKTARGFVDDVWVVDDGSSDNTAEVARAAGATVIRHEQNQGKGASLIDGLTRITATDTEIVLLLDADGQHDPQEIPQFLAVQQQTNATIVLGNRMNDTRDMPPIRRATNRVMSWLLSRYTGQSIPDCSCGYRLLHRRALADLKLQTHNYQTDQEMLLQLARAGHRIASTPIRTIYAGAPSHIRPLRDTWRFLKLLWVYRT